MKFRVIAMMSAPMLMVAACASESDPQPDVEVAEGDESASQSAEVGGLTLENEPGEGATLVESGGSEASFDADCLITETGVAGISMPATTGGFVEAFPAGTGLSFQPVYMVDFGALCARADGEDALCVIFESYDVEEYRPDIPVMAMGVYASECRTAEGIGPGSSIEETVTAYGAARFGFSYENEAREYVSFANAPDAYSFRADSEAVQVVEGEGDRPSGRYGGDYAGVVGDTYFETNTAQPDARLWEIWISTPL